MIENGKPTDHVIYHVMYHRFKSKTLTRPGQARLHSVRPGIRLTRPAAIALTNISVQLTSWNSKTPLYPTRVRAAPCTSFPLRQTDFRNASPRIYTASNYSCHIVKSEGVGMTDWRMAINRIISEMKSLLQS